MQIFNSHLWLLVRRLCSLTLNQSWLALKLVEAIWTGQHLTMWLVYLHFRNPQSLAFTFKSTFPGYPSRSRTSTNLAKLALFIASIPMSLKNIVMQINQYLYFLSLFKSKFTAPRNSILDPWFSITLAIAHLEMCVCFLQFMCIFSEVYHSNSFFLYFILLPLWLTNYLWLFFFLFF